MNPSQHGINKLKADESTDILLVVSKLIMIMISQHQKEEGFLMLVKDLRSDPETPCFFFSLSSLLALALRFWNHV